MLRIMSEGRNKLPAEAAKGRRQGGDALEEVEEVALRRRCLSVIMNYMSA